MSLLLLAFPNKASVSSYVFQVITTDVRSIAPESKHDIFVADPALTFDRGLPIAQQIIDADIKEVRNSLKHITPRGIAELFPIGYSGFVDTQLLGYRAGLFANSLAEVYIDIIKHNFTP